MLRLPVLVALVLICAGCSRTREVAHVAPPPVPVTVQPSMPPGAHPGMAIPARLADGSYATPNRALSEAGATWHLRAALNVAALACRGPAEATIVARYNAMLRTHAAALKSAEAALSAEYRAGGGNWQDRYDDAMTRLYNFFSQSFARDAFCATAAATLDRAAVQPAGGLAASAAIELAALERPFTDFYRAYDAWRSGVPIPVTVFAANAPPRVPAPVAAAAAARAPARAAPRLELDLSALRD